MKEYKMTEDMAKNRSVWPITTWGRPIDDNVRKAY